MQRAAGTPDLGRSERALVLLFALVHVASALAFVLRRDGGADAALVGFPLDDSWIHHVYARSVAAGGLFEYVPGVPEAGFTSPLWVLCLAPLWWLTSDPHVVSLGTKVLGVGLGIATSVVAARLATKLSGRTWVGALAGLAIAIDPSLTFSEVSGMEVSLAAFFIVSSVLAWASSRTRLAGLCFALAVAARPETALIAMWLTAGTIFERWALLRRRDRAAIRELELLLAPSFFVGAWWSLFCLWVAGRPLPNTFYAKHHPGSLLEALDDVPRVFGPQLLDSAWFFFGGGLVLFALAAFRLASPSGLGRARGLVVAGVPSVFLAGVAWAHDVAYVEEFCTLRYTLPVSALVITLLAVGAGEAVDRVRRSPRAARILCAVALALPLVGLSLRFDRVASEYAWNCQNIEEMQVAAGLWAREHTSEGDLIATHDAGAIRLFSDRRVLDIAGLNEHRTSALGYEILDVEPPRLFILFPSWFPEIAASPRVREVHRLSARRYTISPNQHYFVVLEPLRVGEPLELGSE
jgi:hypothetical protein